MKRHIIYFLSAYAMACLTLGCAGSFKARLVAAHQGAETALAAVDDTERLLCWNTTTITGFTKAQLDHCTTGKIPDATHQKISAFLIDAFHAQARLAPVIQAIQPNQPVPADLTLALADADQIGALVSAAVPAGNPWITQALQWAHTLQSLLGMFAK